MTDREQDPGSQPRGVLPSRHGAERVAPVDPEAVLDQLDALDVWHWEDADGARTPIARLGPAAEDFHETFELGADADDVAAGDTDGVALAALQALAEQVEHHQTELGRQARRIEAQRETIESQRDDIESLRETVESLVSGVVALRRSLLDDRQP